MPWQPIAEDETISEGDRIEAEYCIQAPDVPGDEILARLQVEKAKLSGELNSELPSCMTADVEDTELNRSPNFVVDGESCEFRYTVTMKITSIKDSCKPVQASVLTSAVVVSVAALAVLLGISLTFHEARKFTSQSEENKEAVENISTGVLLLAGGWAFSQFAGTENLLQADEKVGDNEQ